MAFSKIKGKDNISLIRKFEEKEILEALKECNGNKSSRLNSYIFLFIKKFCHLLRDDVLRISIGLGLCLGEVTHLLSHLYLR